MSLADRIASTQEDFLDAMEQRGFSRDGTVMLGRIPTANGSQKIRLALGEHWPFAPPAVTPEPVDAPDQASWHRDIGGDLCLYTEEDRSGLPWLNPDDLVTKVSEWFDRNAAGWSNDAPDLDLDRYFPSAQPSVTLLYDALDPLVGRFIRLRPTRNSTLTMAGLGTAPAGPSRRHVFGYCADLGAPVTPPRDWSQLAYLLPDAPRVERAIKARRVSVLLLRYDRDGHEGVLALDAAPQADGGIRLLSQPSASASAAVAHLRAGSARTALAKRSVALVGCGAVGSFLADQLVRAGLGRLTLLDDDVLRPGNLVRHLAAADHVGLTKARAVRQIIGGKGSPVEITHRKGMLRTTQDADELISEHDLVIDATADGSASALLRYAAEERGAHILSVCIQNDGTTLRVDIVPPLAGASPLPESPRRPNLTPAYEGGCGSPVSPTPPHAVSETAAMAARHACALLTGHPVHPSGELRDLPIPALPAGSSGNVS